MRIVLLFILLIWYYDFSFISPDQIVLPFLALIRILLINLFFNVRSQFLLIWLSLFQLSLTLAGLYSHSQLIYLLILIISHENQHRCLFGYFLDINYLPINLIRNGFLLIIFLGALLARFLLNWESSEIASDIWILSR